VSEKREISLMLLYGVSVIDKTLLRLVNTSEEFSICIIFYFFLDAKNVTPD
jgi:hypothetical protein